MTDRKLVIIQSRPSSSAAKYAMGTLISLINGSSRKSR